MIEMLVSQRNSKGLSQADLALLLGKPPSFVGKYELGERRLDMIECLVILRVLDLEPEVFLKSVSAFLPDGL